MIAYQMEPIEASKYHSTLDDIIGAMEGNDMANHSQYGVRIILYVVRQWNIASANPIMP